MRVGAFFDSSLTNCYHCEIFIFPTTHKKKEKHKCTCTLVRGRLSHDKRHASNNKVRQSAVVFCRFTFYVTISYKFGIESSYTFSSKSNTEWRDPDQFLHSCKMEFWDNRKINVRTGQSERSENFFFKYSLRSSIVFL